MQYDTSCTIHDSFCTVHDTVCTVHDTVCSVLDTVCSVLDTVHTVHRQALLRCCCVSDRCFKAHDKLPYRWQVQEGDKWIALLQNELIEKDYCDPSKTCRFWMFHCLHLNLNTCCVRVTEGFMILCSLLVTSHLCTLTRWPVDQTKSGDSQLWTLWWSRPSSTPPSGSGTGRTTTASGICTVQTWVH